MMNNIKLIFTKPLIKLKYKMIQIKGRDNFSLLHSIFIVLGIIISVFLMPSFFKGDKYELFITSELILENLHIQNLYWSSAFGLLTIIALFFTLTLPKINSSNFYSDKSKKGKLVDKNDNYTYIVIFIYIIFLYTFPFFQYFSNSMHTTISLLLFIIFDVLLLMYGRYINLLKRLDKTAIIDEMYKIINNDLILKNKIKEDVKKIYDSKNNEILINAYPIEKLDNFYVITDELEHTISTIDSIIKEAIQNNNYTLLKYGLGKLSKYCIDRLNTFSIDTKYNFLSQFSNDIDNDDFDRVINFVVIEKFRYYTEIAYIKKDRSIFDELSNAYFYILSNSKNSYFNNFDDYLITVKVIFSDYQRLFDKSVKINYNDFSNGYCRKLESIIDMYEYEKSRNIRITISENNYLALKDNTAADWFIINNVVLLQNALLNSVVQNYKSNSSYEMKKYLDDFQKIINQTLMMFVKNRYPKEISFELIFRPFISMFVKNSNLNIITKIYNTKHLKFDSSLDKEKEFIEVLELYSDFFDKISDIFSILDVKLKIDYEAFLDTVIQILVTFSLKSKSKKESRKVLIKYLKIYSNIVSQLPKESSIYKEQKDLYKYHHYLNENKLEHEADILLENFIKNADLRLGKFGDVKERWEVRVYSEIIYIISQMPKDSSKEHLNKICNNIKKEYNNSLMSLKVIVRDMESKINGPFGSQFRDLKKQIIDVEKLQKFIEDIKEIISVEEKFITGLDKKGLLKLDKTKTLHNYKEKTKEDLISFLLI